MPPPQATLLDRLLDEEWLRIDGVSGTSAGAMNAAVLVDGFERGSRQGAREALARFWRAVSDAARFSPLQRGPLDVLLEDLGGAEGWARALGVEGVAVGDALAVRRMLRSGDVIQTRMPIGLEFR